MLTWKSVYKDSYPDYLQAIKSEGKGRIGVLVQSLLDNSRYMPNVVMFMHVNFSPLIASMRFSRSTRFVTLFYGREAWARLPWLRRTAALASDRIWSISRYTSEQLSIVNGVPPQKIRHFRLGLNEGHYRALTSEVARRKAGLNVLTVSRLVERSKGLEDLVRAWQQVVARFPAARLRIVGDGPARSSLQALVRELGISSAVALSGTVNDSELVSAYGDADLFVLPSAQEGFGLVFLEAMAAGLPVIAADSGASPELVQDGVTGRLVRFGDTSGISDAICDLLGRPGLRTKLGDQAAERVKSDFTMPVVTRKMAELLEDAMRG